MSPWGSSVASLKWKLLATKTKLSLFQLSPSMPNTGGTDAGLLVWPTPRVSDTEGGIVKNVEYQNGSFSRKNKQGVRWGVKLKDAVSHAEKLWPTPRASEWKGVGPLGSKSHKHRVKKGYLDATVQEVGQVTGQLNPTFPEYLMGYPIGWTDLNVSGTASSLLSQCTLDEPSSRQTDD